MISNNRGDTIVEVLLAMSIIGIVLGAAFGIANRSVNVGQDAQERTEALKIAESQLEIFKSQYPKDQTIRLRTDQQPFCFDIKAVNSQKNSDDAACSGINGSGASGLYSVSIIPPNATSLSKSYEIRVIWQRIGGGPDNNLSLYYKPGAI